MKEKFNRVVDIIDNSLSEGATRTNKPAKKLAVKQQQKLSSAISIAGFDGNKNFRSPEEGLQVAISILYMDGIELDMGRGMVSQYDRAKTQSVVRQKGKHFEIYPENEGRVTIPLQRRATEPYYITMPLDNGLVFAWYQRESGNYEITGYIS